MKKITLLLSLLSVSGLMLDSCRPRSTKNRNTSANKNTQQTQQGPSAQQVLTKADSTLAKVSALSQEPQESAPPVTSDDYPKTPWGSSYIPKPDVSAYSIYEAGLGNFTHGEYEKALANFSQVVVTGSPSEAVPGAYYWMGECYFAMQRYPESLPYFEYTVKVGPNFKRESAFYKLSRANYSMGNTQAAGMWYERLMTEFPKSPNGAKLRKLGIQ